MGGQSFKRGGGVDRWEIKIGKADIFPDIATLWDTRRAARVLAFTTVFLMFTCNVCVRGSQHSCRPIDWQQQQHNPVILDYSIPVLASGWD